MTVTFEGDKGSERISSIVKGVSDEMSIVSFTKLGSPCVKACVIQYGRRYVEVGGEKNFHELARMWGLNQSNLMVCLGYFFVR